MHVLTVSRWYPSHDAPFRGAFVADLVRALTATNAEVVVASWDAALLRGRRLTDLELERAVATWRSAVTAPESLNRPASWGAGAAVARLPEVDDAERSGWRDRVRAHAALLEPFVEALAERWPIDLVHAHTGVPDGLVAAGIAARLGVPLVVTEHASDAVRSITRDPALAAAYRRLLERNTRLVAVSHATARGLAAALGVEAGLIQVIGNVVDTPAFTPTGAAARDPGELLFVGERSEKKGTDVLLAAMARLAADHPELRLRLIGRAPTLEIEAHWIALAMELGIADRLAFEGPADRAGVAAAMARAAVFVHPSPAETFGVVAAEAAASGLPVAATPSGGVEDVIGLDGALGTIAASHDPVDLARAVEDVLARRGDFDPAGMRRSIDERFSPPRVAAAYRRLYDGLSTDRLPTGSGEGAVGRAVPVTASGPARTGPPPGATFLLVGTQRGLLDRRLTQLSWQERSDLTVLTIRARGASPGGAGGVGSLVAVDPDGPFDLEMSRLAGPRLAGLPTVVARPLRLLLRPRAALARRRLRAQRDELRRRQLEWLVLEAWKRRSAAGAEAWLVALDPMDVLASRAALEAGARLAPGGMRWLADRLDAQASDAEQGAS